MNVNCLKFGSYLGKLPALILTFQNRSKSTCPKLLKIFKLQLKISFFCKGEISFSFLKQQEKGKSRNKVIVFTGSDHWEIRNRAGECYDGPSWLSWGFLVDRTRKGLEVQVNLWQWRQQSLECWCASEWKMWVCPDLPITEASGW